MVARLPFADTMSPNYSTNCPVSVSLNLITFTSEYS